MKPGYWEALSSAFHFATFAVVGAEGRLSTTLEGNMVGYENVSSIDPAQDY